MKLVEILARELGEWPEQAEYIVQEGDEELYQAWGDTPVYNGHHSWRDGDDGDGAYFNPPIHLDLSDDWKSAVLTRADWEAERARIKGEKAMPKANKDGWIRHRGGNCPSNVTDRIDVRFRDGEIGVFRCPITLKWVHEHEEYDIMAWRPHNPEQIEPKVDTASMIEQGWLEPLKDKEECMVLDYKPTESSSLYVQQYGRAYRENPLQWRDRIRELDEQREEVCALYNRQVAEINEERTSLVAKLKAEGFELIQSDESNDVVESAQDDIAQQDMSDPANWRVGDLFEIIGKDSHEFPMGELVKLENYHDEEDGHRYAYLDGRDYWWVCNCNVRWHSRPTN